MGGGGKETGSCISSAAQRYRGTVIAVNTWSVTRVTRHIQGITVTCKLNFTRFLTHQLPLYFICTGLLGTSSTTSRYSRKKTILLVGPCGQLIRTQLTYWIHNQHHSRSLTIIYSPTSSIPWLHPHSNFLPG